MTDTEHDHWDAIVIGSGIGGMAAAAALSRVGHKVLLLEQHQTLGGLTHSFSRDGFTWDVGMHYLGGMAPGDHERELLDWLSETPIDFVSLGSIYDTLHIGSAEPLSLSRPYEAQEMDLKDRFPEQAEAIEAWTHALREGREAMYKIFPTRAMPEIAGDMLDWWNRRAIANWCARTTKEVIDDGAPPCLAASFGSLKNPKHDPGPRQKHMGQFLTWTDWASVAQWADRPAGARGDDYADFKRRVEDTLMAQFESYFPDLAKLVVYRELATPLSTVSFTGHRKGAFYGLDVTPERVMCDALRAKTPIPGLYLAGQDVASPGIPGALWGGLLSAASIDPKVFPKFSG